MAEKKSKAKPAAVEEKPAEEVVRKTEAAPWVLRRQAQLAEVDRIRAK